MDIKKQLRKRAVQTDRALGGVLPKKGRYPARLVEAMRYSVFSGGKRVRPFLVLESAKMCGVKPEKALPLACAVELVHAYSLVHDDLPSMDDDDYRRGRKTCHRQYDEATAVLVGDALLTLAFQVLASARGCPDGRLKSVIRILSEAAGVYGMVGGQAADLAYQRNAKSLAELKRVNRMKTGALITSCTEAGAVWAGARPAMVRRARVFGEQAGFLFQLVDDIIDGDGYAARMGAQKAYWVAAGVRDEAKKQLGVFGKKAAELLAFTDFLYERKT